MGTFDCCSINVINVAVALILDSDKYTPQYASNVYIAAFITSYAHVKLYKAALLPLGEMGL